MVRDGASPLASILFPSARAARRIGRHSPNPSVPPVGFRVHTWPPPPDAALPLPHSMDNSEFQRNGDYAPTRLVAQRETINHISLSKTESNQESVVGLLTMGGSVKVLCAPSRNLSMLMGELKNVTTSGKCNFLAGIKTAQLALKNRQNKSQHPRIMLFVGSPIEDEMKKLVKIGEDLKKNSYAVDVVNFGKENVSNENKEKLEAFVKAVDNEGNSHLVSIPPGSQHLSDVVVSSPILGGAASAGGFGGGAWGGAAAGGAVSNGGGVGAADQTEDQMIAYAKRISMEEARARAAAASSPENKASGESKTEPQKQETTMDVDEDEDDEDEELQRAMALSMAMNQDEDEDQDGDEEPGQGGSDGKNADLDDDVMEAFKDDNFIEELIDEAGVPKGDLDINKLLDFDEDEDNDGKQQ